MTIEDYIKQFPKQTQNKLWALRTLVLENFPEAIESISYGMPAYKLNGKPFIYFGGFKTHIGLYATPTTHEKFKEKLSKYKQGKGSVQFPLDSTLPLDLILEMLQFKADEILRK